MPPAPGARSGVGAGLAPETKEWPRCACTASATLSSAVKSANSEVTWNERASPSALRRHTGSAVISRPAKRMRPALGHLAGEFADQRCLAGTVGPIMGCKTAERHRVGGDHAAEAFGQSVDGQRLQPRATLPASR